MAFDFTIKENDEIKGVFEIIPTIGQDHRGNIWSSFIANEIQHLIPPNLAFKHDKFSRSGRNVLRGIHGDQKSWKLVTCVYGEIHQVVVDLRKDSPTYQRWSKYVINKKNQMLVLIPPNFGNAYYVSSAEAVYHYKLAYQGEYIDADDQFSLKWNDPRLSIDWPCDSPILSIRDQ